MALDVLRDFGRRRARIGIDARQTGVERALCKRLVAEQQFFVCHRISSLRLFPNFTNLEIFRTKSNPRATIRRIFPAFEALDARPEGRAYGAGRGEDVLPGRDADLLPGRTGSMRRPGRRTGGADRERGMRRSVAGVYGLKCSKPERAGRSAGREPDIAVAVGRCAGVSGAKTPRARNRSGPEAAGCVCAVSGRTRGNTSCTARAGRAASRCCGSSCGRGSPRSRRSRGARPIRPRSGSFRR